ncbi:MAG TPA: PQQ-dependent sugar dehydrogenase [Pirellulaceae bacterium]|nr:PQQ-dependent sugar dehydrogenase [Pirellulaceae bacterium]
MTFRLILRVSALLALLAGMDHADEPAAKRPLFECRFTDGPIKIDGKADDEAWKHAQVIDKFTVSWLKEPRPAKTTTKARLLWDREYLYFLAEMQDGDLFADVKERDGKTWFNDVFELFFKPAVDKPGYYEFQVNAAGTEMDMFIAQREAGAYEKYIKEGEFDFDSQVVLRGTLERRDDKDEGWTVEGRIKWIGFLKTGGRPAVDETWRFALCRYDYNKAFGDPDLSTCAPLTKPSFHQHEDYADLKFVGPKEGAGIKPQGIKAKLPLTTSRVVGSPDPPLPYRPAKAFPELKLTYPIAVDRIPGMSELFVIAQDASYGPAELLLVVDDPSESETTSLLKVADGGTAYGIAFHPKFAENGYLYVGWNGAIKPEEKKRCRITRYKMVCEAPITIDPNSALEIISWESDGHNGADVTFGLDGMLYVTSGDGTSDSDTNVMGQRLDTLLSKVLRIDVDHPEGDKPYSIPKDNPFLGQEGVVPETYAYGFRNPWRITTDEKTGHIWVGNNGQDLWEQIYFVRPGDNFGWSVYEGSHPFYLERKLGPHPHSMPAAEHPHSDARSLTGGVVYYGTKLPELIGAYIYGDHSTGRIWGIRHDGTKVTWHKLLADTPFNISGFGIDSHGELLVLDHQAGGKGGIYHLEPTPIDKNAPHFPRKLSESGLFADVAKHAMAPGVIPYSVNSPLWSDGAYKERYIAIPHKEDQDMRIGISTNRGWFFPDDAVLVKSFALEEQPGDPSTRKWVETRFLVKQQNEWVGYSYTWNDEQTDATLVDAAGADREYSLRVPRSRAHPDGQRKQVWHYPSRVECMVCHSRAANYVLGLSEAQMNKEHDYGGIVDNQLRVLESLGMLKVDYRGETIAAMKDELKAAGKEDKEIDRVIDQKIKSSGQRQSPGDTTMLSRLPENYRKLVDPYDANQPLEARAKSYLHANCSHCHVEAGGGNSQMELEFVTPLAKMRLVDVLPVHNKFGIEDARLVAPGHPERSVLLHRVAHRGPNSGGMPQVGTNVVDEAAVKLLREWIAGMREKDREQVRREN